MATIIKHESLHALSGKSLRGVAYDLADMATQADDYLQSVRREAGKIVEEARREAAAVRSQAEAAGRRAAEEAIERVLDDKVAKQMQTLIPALNNAVAQIEDSRAQWQRAWETSAVTLSTAIAERLVRAELAHRPEITVAWMREALQLATGSTELTIQLSPSDFQALRQQAEELSNCLASLGKTQVVADATIAAGGCRVVTEFGSVDMQLQSQLDRIAQELIAE